MALARKLTWGCVIAVLALAGPRARAESEAVRQALDPGQANTIRFAAVEAKYLRVVILRSHTSQPCIDELEIYGPGSRENLALATRGAKASASSTLDGYAAHRVEHLNDGQYGNAHSWIPKEMPAWAQIELPAETVVQRVVFSRDRMGAFQDRVPTTFEILVSLDGRVWQTVKKITALPDPLLDFGEILVLKRKTPTEQRAVYWQWGQKYGMPVNWSCDFRPNNQPIAAWWEDELAALSLGGGKNRLRTVFKPPVTHMLQHPELHFDAQRMLFSMPGPNGAFQVFEVGLDGTGLRQITRDTGPDVDNGDPCYLPDGRIVFNSTRMFAGVPCEDGESYISGLCLTDAAGQRTRMLTFDQESNW